MLERRLESRYFCAKSTTPQGPSLKLSFPRWGAHKCEHLPLFFLNISCILVSYSCSYSRFTLCNTGDTFAWWHGMQARRTPLWCKFQDFFFLSDWIRLELGCAAKPLPSWQRSPRPHARADSIRLSQHVLFSRLMVVSVWEGWVVRSISTRREIYVNYSRVLSTWQRVKERKKSCQGC